MAKLRLEKLFFCLFFFCFYLLTPFQALASSEFKTDYQVRYEINSSGVAHASQEVSLTNKLSNVYATRYSFSIEAKEIKNISAFDSMGPLETQIQKQAGTTTILITFNEQAAGIDKTLKFNLEYDVVGLATKNGQVWEVNIPKLAEESQIDSYQLTLAVPQSFGEAAHITPKPISKKTEGNFNLFYFAKDQLTKAGVSTIFGTFQIFDFSLFYHLKNPELTSAETTIAVPPDTAYQQVYYSQFEPAPLNVFVDGDGNWLARYRLSGKESLDVKLTGKAKVFAHPQEFFLGPSLEVLEENLKADFYWEADNEKIKNLAENASSPQAIYNLVIKTLDYDYSRVKRGAKRLGALGALEAPDQAICTEFTDLFVALSRTAGIPAREINGYAYTTNEQLRPLGLVADILHAWPEYWDEDKNVWVPVDPTWGDTTGGVDYFTKLDLNHFAFAIHGIDSQSPYPAGSYKQEDTIQKDIHIDFGEYEPTPINQLEVKFNLPPRIFAGIQAQGSLIVKNAGQKATYNLPVKIEAEGLAVLPQQETVLIIPPQGNQEIKLKINSLNWFKTGSTSIKVLAENKEFVYNLRVESLIWHQIVPILGGGFAGVIFFLFAYKAGRLLIQKLRR